MEKKRKIFLSTLNVAMHSPHSPSRYLDLFWDMARAKRIISMGKIHGAVLGSLELHGEGELLFGEIYRFIRVDPSEPWFNAMTKKAASDADIEKIYIPPALFPHLHSVPFVFNPKSHKLHFVAKDRDKSISPAVMGKIIQNLINPLIHEERFPHVEVTVVPESDSLDKILGMHRLNTLVISLVRPNPDGSDKIREKILKKLESQRARRRVETLTAIPGESLEPDMDTRMMAEVASENGFVRGVGSDANGNHVEESTNNSPKMTCITLDPKMEGERDVLLREAII